MGIGRQINNSPVAEPAQAHARDSLAGRRLALLTLGSAIRRKGWVGGALDTALDFTPVVGTMKNVAEVGRGRDFIRDKIS